MEKYKIIAIVFASESSKAIMHQDQKLPAEGKWETNFAASKLTVKKALDISVGEGLDIKRRGAGTFVKSLSVPE